MFEIAYEINCASSRNSRELKLQLLQPHPPLSSNIGFLRPTHPTAAILVSLDPPTSQKSISSTPFLDSCGHGPYAGYGQVYKLGVSGTKLVGFQRAANNTSIEGNQGNHSNTQSCMWLELRPYNMPSICMPCTHKHNYSIGVASCCRPCVVRNCKMPTNRM